MTNTGSPRPAASRHSRASAIRLGRSSSTRRVNGHSAPLPPRRRSSCAGSSAPPAVLVVEPGLARLLGGHRHARMQPQASGGPRRPGGQVLRPDQGVVAHLDRIERAARQILEEIQQTLRECGRLTGELPADRGKLEYQRPRLVSQALEAGWTNRSVAYPASRNAGWASGGAAIGPDNAARAQHGRLDHEAEFRGHLLGIVAELASPPWARGSSGPGRRSRARGAGRKPADRRGPAPARQPPGRRPAGPVPKCQDEVPSRMLAGSFPALQPVRVWRGRLDRMGFPGRRSVREEVELGLRGLPHPSIPRASTIPPSKKAPATP